MATKQSEDFSFFYQPGSVEDPVVQKEMAEREKQRFNVQPKKSFSRKWIVGIIIPIVVTGLVIVSFYPASSEKQMEKPVALEVVKQPSVFATPDELARVRGGETGPYINHRLDSDLDTGKTQAQVAQDNAINKMKELTGVVQTYAPQLLDSK